MDSQNPFNPPSAGDFARASVWRLLPDSLHLVPLTSSQDSTSLVSGLAVTAETLVVRIVDSGSNGSLGVAIVATLAAVAGTIFAGRQAKLAREALSAAISPSIACTVDMAGDERGGAGFRLHNAGPGAACITRFALLVDGRPVAGSSKGGWVEVFRLLGLADSDWRKAWYDHGMYLAPGETDLLLAYRGQDWQSRQQVLRQALRRIAIEVEYKPAINSGGVCRLVAADVIAVVEGVGDPGEGATGPREAG